MCVRASVYCGLPTVPSATPLTQTECDAHVYVAHVWFRYGYVMVMVPPSTMLVCVCGRGAHVGRGEGLDPQPHNADGEARAQESSAEPYVSYQCGSQPQAQREFTGGLSSRRAQTNRPEHHLASGRLAHQIVPGVRLRHVPVPMDASTAQGMETIPKLSQY